jgi:hypothetical protein
MMDMALDEKRKDHIDINQRRHPALERSSSLKISASSLFVRAGMLVPPADLVIGG